MLKIRLQVSLLQKKKKKNQKSKIKTLDIN